MQRHILAMLIIGLITSSSSLCAMENKKRKLDDPNMNDYSLPLQDQKIERSLEEQKKDEKLTEYFDKLVNLVIDDKATDVYSFLSEYTFEKQSFDYKQSLFLDADRAPNPELVNKMIGYLEIHAKEEGSFLRRCHEFDTQRWVRYNLTVSQLIQQYLEKFVRENKDKDKLQISVNQALGNIKKLQQGADPEKLFNETLITSLLNQQAENHTKRIKNFELLLQQFVQVYPTKKTSEFMLLWNKCNLFMLAVQIGSVKHIEQFAQLIDINQQDDYKRNALFYCNDVEIAKQLIKNGINSEAVDMYERNALFYIKDYATAEYLVQNKYTSVMCVDKIERTVLFECQNAKLIKLYIQAGADVHHADIYGETPLFAHGDNKEIVELLHAQGAKVDIKNKSKQTALFKARTP